uniref:Uncharacterized protein n=1 Tax=Bos indicus x Bos taurus TaxID=30522 RepID=A0A4W2ED16_BOBOX
MAMAATWALVLVVMGLGLARARAVPTTTRKGCNTGMFKSLLPGELEAFKKEKDRNSLEDSLLQKDWDCISHLFPRTRDLKHLQVNWESQAHLPSPGPTLPSSSSSSGGLSPPLSHLPVSHTTLFCARVWAQPTAGCRPQGLFQHWLPQLQEQETSHLSHRSLKTASRPAPFNLFHLLTWDVNCVTRRDMCI